MKDYNTMIQESRKVNELVTDTVVKTMKESVAAATQAQEELNEGIQKQIAVTNESLEFIKKNQGHFIDMVDKNMRAIQSIWFDGLEQAASYVQSK